MSVSILVVGTDTGVGKTVLTALLLDHLRTRGTRALAIKPFATGSRADAELLSRVQNAALTLDAVNPFFFREPLAPLVAARLERRRVPLTRALAVIRAAQPRYDVLLVEACGGLLTPLGPGYSARELARKLGARVVVVAADRLGVLNQVLLTLAALHASGLSAAAIVLMGRRRPDESTQTNAPTLRRLAAPTPVFTCPHLGRRVSRAAGIAKAAHEQAAWLARLAAALGDRSV